MSELNQLVALERRITDRDADSLVARWEFGHELLADRDGRGRLPNGHLARVSEETGASRRELKYRMQFADRFSTREELGNVIAQFGSWWRITQEALPEPKKRPDPVPVNNDDSPERAGLYGAIVADPPWQYDNRATRGAAEDHYPTLTVEELCELPVADWAAPASHLYLWTTNGFLREAFDIVDAWGFEYKTCLTWVKPQIGMGNYFRSSTEHILFGARDGLRTTTGNCINWFEAKRGRHSKKPGRIFEIVEAESPAPYLEMFARDRRLGDLWDVWGNEV